MTFVADILFICSCMPHKSTKLVVVPHQDITIVKYTSLEGGWQMYGRVDLDLTPESVNLYNISDFSHVCD